MAFHLQSQGQDFDQRCDYLFEEVKRVYSEEKRLTYDLLSILQFVFQGPLLPALDLVEKESVTKLVSPSERELFQVMGTSGTPYICFPNLKYCTCPAYQYSVLIQEEYAMCKHVLAMRLAVAMRICKQMTIQDEEMKTMIQDMD